MFIDDKKIDGMKKFTLARPIEDNKMQTEMEAEDLVRYLKKTIDEIEKAPLDFWNTENFIANVTRMVVAYERKKTRYRESVYNESIFRRMIEED